MLVEALLQDISRSIGRPCPGLTPEARDLLMKYAEQALRETDGNKAKTARRLGLTRTQLYVRLRKSDIGLTALS